MSCRSRLAAALFRAAMPLVAALSSAACRMETQVRLVSNVPDTEFRIREERDRMAADEGWRTVGRGEEVSVTLRNFTTYRIVARAEGYREKVVANRLNDPEPGNIYRVEFLDVDRTAELPETVARNGGPEAEAAGSGTQAGPGEDLPPFTGQRHALIVGISSYSDPDFKSLQKARRDAEDLARFLEDPKGANIATSRIHLLVDDEATRAKIIEQLLEISRTANQGDLIILYFACHAQSQGGEGTAKYLVPFDAEIDNPAGTAIEKDEIVRLLDKGIPERQLLVLDCCFAGGPVVRGDTEPEDVWKSLSARGRVVLTSTKGNETALDGEPKDANSPFARALLATLQNPFVADKDENGCLTVQELYDAISPEVRRAALSVRQHAMTPQLYGRAAAEIPVLCTQSR